MRHTLWTLLLGLLLVSCAADPPAATWGEFERWGTLREALREGKVEARVEVSDVAAPGVWGVGALEGLRGEITVADGEVWVTEGGAAPETRRGADLAAPATVLFTGRVAGWWEVAVEHDVAAADLDAFVAARARTVGLDPDDTFPFVVEGSLRDLRLHVIAGACPVRARALGQEPDPPAYEARFQVTPGRLVGIYAPQGAGVVCHHGSRSHVHALLEQPGAWTGHVESVGLKAGSRLLLPRPPGS